MKYCEVAWCIEKGWMHTWADPKPKTYFFIELSLSNNNNKGGSDFDCVCKKKSTGPASVYDVNGQNDNSQVQDQTTICR
jgi:hypothetical protein